MLKKKLSTFIIPLVLMVALTACSSNGGTAQAASNGTGAAANSTQSKLAMGTLKLEGTGQAVTAAEAKELLPLWKAVKSLSSNSSAAPQEVEALYKQIQETMTADQVSAIEKMQFTQDDMSTMMKSLGIEMPAAGQAPMSGQVSATRTAKTGSNQGGFPGGGDPGMMGGAPGGGGPEGGFPGGGTNGRSSTQTSTQRTPQPGQMGRGGGMSNLFVEPLIKLLETRAAQ